MKKKYSATGLCGAVQGEVKISKKLTTQHREAFEVRRGRRLYFVMPFIKGRTLRTRLREEGKLDPVEAARIVREVCRALEYAHDNNVIHRDIKPDNIMEDGKGWMYLTDFGISKAVAESTITLTGAFMGTAEYMSPEQCRNSKDVDGRSDLYSLGIVLYEMLTGRVPFTGEMLTVVQKHLGEAPAGAPKEPGGAEGACADCGAAVEQGA
jgi:serine/threonine protein kinase